MNEYVYMIYDQRYPTDILYVGKTNNITNRYQSHFFYSEKKIWITTDNREYMIMREIEEVSKNIILFREKYWIQTLHPKYNIRHNTRGIKKN